MQPSSGETWVVLRAQAGDRASLDELFCILQRPLGGYLRRLVGDAAQAEDVLQEVFVLLYRKLPWLRDPSLFRPWAYRIASREAIRHLRRERRWSQQERDPAVLDQLAATDVTTLEPDLGRRLAELVGLLSPRSRVVVVLHYFGELTLQEVADVLKVSSGTVKSRLAYGLQTMRRAIAEARVQQASGANGAPGGSNGAEQ